MIIVKVTTANIKKVFDYIQSQIADENGRGEYDNESDLLNATERTIEMFEEEIMNSVLKCPLENVCGYHPCCPDNIKDCKYLIETKELIKKM